MRSARIARRHVLAGEEVETLYGGRIRAPFYARGTRYTLYEIFDDVIFYTGWLWEREEPTMFNAFCSNIWDLYLAELEYEGNGEAFIGMQFALYALIEAHQFDREEQDILLEFVRDCRESLRRK